MKRINPLKSLLCVLVLLGCMGCGTMDPAGKSALAAADDAMKVTLEDPALLLRVNSLLILPPQYERGMQRTTVDGEQISTILRITASEELSLELHLPESQAEQGAGSRRMTVREMQSKARALGADAVLVTTIESLVKRIGSAVGASQPAQVGFRMELYRATDFASVWSASYFVRDRALAENLLSMQAKVDRGARWNEASSLLRSGFAAAFRTFSSQREEEFRKSKT